MVCPTTTAPNGARNLGGAVSNDYAFQGDKQMTFGAGASYAFGPATIGFVYTQSKIDGAKGFGSSPMPAGSGTSDVNVSNYEPNRKHSLTPASLVHQRGRRQSEGQLESVHGNV